MEIMPPPGSMRRRIAIGVLFSWFALATGVTVLGVIQWIRHEGRFPGRLVVAWAAVGIGLRLMWVASRKAESRESEGLDERAGEPIERGVHK